MPRHLVKCRRFIPSIVDVCLRLGTARRLVGEEGEDFVLPNWAAHAATQLSKEIGVAQILVTRTVKGLEGVQSGSMKGAKETAVDLIGAALGRN